MAQPPTHARRPRHLLSAPPHITVRSHIFVDVQHGLGNRLRALASAAVIAQSSDRQLVVIWRPDHHCQARIGDLLHYDGPVLEDDRGDLIRNRCARVFNYMEIEPGAAFQEPILIAPDRAGGDIYIRSAYTLNSPLTNYPAEDRFLKNLVPSAAVLDLVRSVARPSDVAVHIRMGTGPDFDHLSYESPENWPLERHQELLEWRRKSDVSRFIRRLDQVFETGDVKTAFVAADLQATYAALIDRFGPRIRYLRRAEYDRSRAQLQTALADLILLTAAPLFLGSTWSSFSDIAQRLARPNRRFEKSGVDF